MFLLQNEIHLCILLLAYECLICFFVTNACFNTALPHCLFIEYEFQVCVCVSANDIKLVQALGNIISLAMKHLLTLNMKRIFVRCFYGSEAMFFMLYIM